MIRQIIAGYFDDMMVTKVEGGCYICWVGNKMNGGRTDDGKQIRLFTEKDDGFPVGTRRRMSEVEWSKAYFRREVSGGCDGSVVVYFPKNGEPYDFPIVFVNKTNRYSVYQSDRLRGVWIGLIPLDSETEFQKFGRLNNALETWSTVIWMKK